MELLPGETTKNLFIIGILGGVASGKSTVGTIFNKLGAENIDADAISHDVLDEPEVKQKLSQIFGEHVLVQGGIDRSALAKLVFEDKEKLKVLENIVHPIVGQNILKRLSDIALIGPKVVILDIPLLWKTPLMKICNLIVFVDVPLELREKRAQSRGWENEEIRKRESHQISVENKRAISKCVIDNSGSIEKTKSIVKLIWKENIPAFFKQL